MESQHSRLISLPREIRDMIYHEYVYSEEGYMYDLPSGKLRHASGALVDLNLRHTCAQIANETRGLALKQNTITFSTYYSDETSMYGARLEKLMKDFTLTKAKLLWYQPWITELDVFQELAGRYPNHTSLLLSHSMSGVYPRQPWGQAGSTRRRFVASALKRLAENPECDFKPDAGLAHDESTGDTDTIVWSDILPWTVPTESTVIDLIRKFSTRQRSYNCGGRVKHYISAAAMCIHFLSSITNEALLEIRNIRILEDHHAVGWAECHAQGLIPFCKKNPRLRIERKADLWRNLSVQTFHADMVRGVRRTYEDDILRSGVTSSAVITWIGEAIVLPSLGMPAGSFRLVIGGAHPREEASLLQHTLWDATIQEALESSVRRRFVSQSSPLKWRSHICYKFDGFPKALSDIRNGKSIVSFGCKVEQKSNIESIVEDRRGWSLTQWNDARAWDSPWDFAYPAALPRWNDILQEYKLDKAGVAYVGSASRCLLRRELPGLKDIRLSKKICSD
ncbi:hypothetical protein P171DRAFT_490310 [Karstenula rhodostoma CBS 690.94]|uniref:Uncharacterized protein n=1 Tax=Karstenula rhodostoma CBS 690.94 TaxID=1392251 RepID=A0A9P4PA31_9PLEO|nr:hypothetical protein P171DRAFT_490310 [Karstenula rhodostoma CBS 690.94]